MRLAGRITAIRSCSGSAGRFHLRQPMRRCCRIWRGQAQAGLGEMALAWEREVFAGGGTDRAWLPQMLAEPGGGDVSRGGPGAAGGGGSRGDTAGAGGGGAGQSVAATGGGDPRRRSAASGARGVRRRRRWRRWHRSWRHCWSRGGRTAAGATDRPYRPMGGACAALEGDDIYQLTLARPCWTARRWASWRTTCTEG